MTVHNVTLDQFARIVMTMDVGMENAIIRGLRSAARRLQTFVVEEIDAAEKVDRGELRGSVSYTREADGAMVSVDAPHASIVDLGTRPFRPPIEPLAAWALRKGLADDEDEAERIAWGIANMIEKFGIRPSNYMAKAWQRVIPVVISEVERELDAL